MENKMKNAARRILLELLRRGIPMNDICDAIELPSSHVIRNTNIHAREMEIKQYNKLLYLYCAYQKQGKI